VSIDEKGSPPAAAYTVIEQLLAKRYLTTVPTPTGVEITAVGPDGYETRWRVHAVTAMALGAALVGTGVAIVARRDYDDTPAPLHDGCPACGEPGVDQPCVHPGYLVAECTNRRCAGFGRTRWCIPAPDIGHAVA
jgi:hypothetical protein